MAHPLQYTEMNLNRSDELRRSTDELENLWQDPNTRVIPLYKNNNLFSSHLEPVIPKQADLKNITINQPIGSFLGLAEKTAYFSIACNDAQAQLWCDQYPDSDFKDLRVAGPALGNNIASILAYSRGLSIWQNNNGYCGKCGGKNKLTNAGHAMHCQPCASDVFPRTDPAVIMMVEHVDDQGIKKCLLGRSPAWPEGVLSTLAGFVETGESLEAAVIREVFEETGVNVIEPTYIVSQPWPFPQSIMLGYTATAVSADIVLDLNELAEANWFSAAEVAKFGDWGSDSKGYKLPRADSIARFLINRWLAENL